MTKRKSVAKQTLKVIGILVAVLAMLAVVLIIWLSATEYKPAAVEQVDVKNIVSENSITKKELSVISWNTGYAGLGDNADFFMDGGEQVKASDEERVYQNAADIAEYLKSRAADIMMLQEVDRDSYRSYRFAQDEYYETTLKQSGVFALNYKCRFVPYPLPPIGKVEAGVLTLTNYKTTKAERVRLPSPFKWPMSVANLKRCLLVTHYPIEDSRKELVMVNLHLEAYDDGGGRAKQLKKMLEVMQTEYNKGNYVIAGGDFNQCFEGTESKYPIAKDLWTPPEMAGDALPEGWEYAFDDSVPTCRLLNEPLEKDTQCYVIDGFILSPNVMVTSVKTESLGFEASDHNPVRLQAVLK